MLDMGVKKMKIRTYSELSEIVSFEDRFDYLKLIGTVGESTFGFERHRNQAFYRSREWRIVRDEVITRDYGCDLGVTGHEIFDRILIHHMNPMRPIDIISGNDDILNPEFLISVTHNTHNAIHFGSKALLAQPVVIRRPGDTQLWGNPIQRSVA